MKPEDFTIQRDLTKQPLTEEETTFLNDNADGLADDVAKHYGIEKSAPPFIPQGPTPPKKDKKDKGEGGEGGEGDDDEDMDPEDEKRINKLFDKRMGPIVQQTQSQGRIFLVDNYLRSITDQVPTAAKYREAMLQTLAVPGYGHLSPQEVFNIVAGAELMRLGAKREREAANKARATQNNGSAPTRPASGGQGKDWSSATPEEVAAKRAEILGRPS